MPTFWEQRLPPPHLRVRSMSEQYDHLRQVAEPPYMGRAMTHQEVSEAVVGGYSAHLTNWYPKQFLNVQWD